MTIDQKALEATRKTILYLNSSSTPWSDDQVSEVIEAYLATLPVSDPDDETRKITAAIELLEDAGWVIRRPEQVPAVPDHAGLVERLETALRDMPTITHGPFDKAAYRRAMLTLAETVREAAAALSAALHDDPDEAYEIGKRDGYEQAVADIDRMTGGDGEYRVSLLVGAGVDEDRHCPDAATMKQRIVDRFSEATALSAGVRVKGLSVDDVERIILETEPSQLSDRSDKIWTRRMATALAARLSALSDAPVVTEASE